MEEMNLSLGQIVTALGEQVKACVIPEKDIRVTGVVIDSRKIVEGAVFIATPGEKVDGHSFIGQVYEKGAALVITQKTPEEVEKEHGIQSGMWGAYILVEDGFAALKAIATYYRKSLRIPVVGITGSVGKTSTKAFIAGVLAEKYNVLKTEGNYNNEIGVPLTLLTIRPSHEVAVVEMGISDFGEMTRLSQMAVPDVMVITNIGQCHLENLKDRDGVFKAKTESFEYMNPEGDVCLYAGDDKLANVSLVHGKTPFFFGKKDSSNVYMENVVSLGLLGSEGEMVFANTGAGEIRCKVKVPLPGGHMVTNATAAATVASILGLAAEEIVRGIEGMQPIGGRNSIVQLSDMTLIDDCYNANPVSMKSSIDLLQMANGETVAVLGDMFELGEQECEFHAQVGEYAVMEGVSRIYCIGLLSKHMYDRANYIYEKKPELCKAGTIQISYWANKSDFLEGLKEDMERSPQERELFPAGCSVLVKASHGMHFEDISKALMEAPRG